MRRTLHVVASLLVATAMLSGSRSFAQSSQRAEEEFQLPDLAGDASSRDFGGAADDVDLEGVVVSDGPLPEESEEEGELPASGTEKHVVETGDTLWDLSSRYLGSPWYWPRVWSFNPQIENPHWIYPGDEVRFGPAGEARPPAAVAASAAPSQDEIDPYEEEEVSLAGEIGYRGTGTARIPSVGFLSADEVGRAGRIVKAWEEKDLLYQGDRIYVELEKATATPGAGAVLFRVEREVRHPESGARLGFVVRILGNAKWIRDGGKEKLATATITRSVSEIARGDLVGPAGFQNYLEIDRVANAASVRATIAATMDDEVRELAQGHLVFLDKGSSHGIRAGNTMTVVRATDGLDDDGFTPRHDDSLPSERIGEILVVDARSNTAVGLVMSSIRELRMGDRVEMVAESSR